MNSCAVNPSVVVDVRRVGKRTASRPREVPTSDTLSVTISPTQYNLPDTYSCWAISADDALAGS